MSISIITKIPASLTLRDNTCSTGLGMGNMPRRVRKGETCPAGLGRRKHAPQG